VISSARKFERLWRYLLIGIFATEVLFTGIDLLITRLSDDSTSSDEVQSDFDNYGLDIV
jgi:hypothetical protein